MDARLDLMLDTEMNQQTDAIIIGGGIAGLTCGVGLADSDLRGVLIEKASFLGGRAASWRDEETGDPVHIGPHILLKGYENFFRLLERLDTQDQVVWQNHEFTVVDGEQALEMRFYDRPPPFHLEPMMDPSMSRLDMLSNVPVTLYTAHLNEDDFLRLDAVDARTFLRSMGVTKKSIDKTWNFVSMAIMNVPIEKCSAGSLMRFQKYMIGRRHFKVGFPGIGLGDLFGPPSKCLLEDKGWTFELGTGVRRLLGDAERVTGVELDDGRIIEAPVVISSLPPNALYDILPERWRARYPTFSALDDFEPCPYVSTYIWFDRKLTDLQFWARSSSSKDLNCDFYDLSNINIGWQERNSVIAANCIYSHRAHHLSDDDLVQATRAELAEFLPEARNARIEHSVVSRIPMAIHCPFPGTEQRRLETQSPVSGLLLAGDWVKTDMPSSMEGAARSGWLAAEAVVESACGRRPALAAPPPTPQGLIGIISGLGSLMPNWLRRLPMRNSLTMTA